MLMDLVSNLAILLQLGILSFTNYVKSTLSSHRFSEDSIFHLRNAISGW